MPRYLLSTRTVLDIVQKKGQPGEVWLTAASRQKGLIARDVCVSAVTPMAARRAIQQRISALQTGGAGDGFSHDDLFQMQRNTELLFRDYAARDCIVPITEEIAARWGDFLDQKIDYVDDKGVSYAIGSVQKLEIATAIIGRGNIPFSYVERRQAALAGLNSLEVVDPTIPIAVKS